MDDPSQSSLYWEHKAMLWPGTADKVGSEDVSQTDTAENSLCAVNHISPTATFVFISPLKILQAS